MSKTLVGAGDFPDGEFPKENIKKIEFDEDGNIKAIEYYEPSSGGKCYHYCNCNCNCKGWQRGPYTPWYTSDDSVTVTSSGDTYSTGSPTRESTTTWNWTA